MQQCLERQTQYIVFTLDEMVLGIDVMRVQEINRFLSPADVPGTSPFVKGVVHLRGEVVTLIDLRELLGIESHIDEDSRKIIVVDLQDERVGLIVDEVRDVITVAHDDLQPVPASFQQNNRDSFSNVVTIDKKLVAILKVEQLLN